MVQTMYTFILYFIYIGFQGCLAGRVPYLGGDLKPYIKESKRDTISTIQQASKAASPQQKEDAQRFNTKFTEIAKAYAEGYKAAIKAVQARALIAQKRIIQNKVDARSVIPGVPAEHAKITERSNVATFQAPVPNEQTENGIEKSGIPRPNIQDSTTFSRPNIQDSTMFRGEENKFDQRSSISNQENQEAKSITDGFASVVKEATLPESKRNTNERKKRSHMPYLGQNLDALGIVRAKPNWEAPRKKSISPNLPEPPAQQQNPASTQQYPAQMAEPENVYMDRLSERRAYDARQNLMSNPFAQRIQQAQQLRQNIPYNPYLMPPPAYPNPYLAGFVSAPPQSVETATVLPAVDRKKKSASPEPDVATLNYAARHRNVYLDGVSGDPNTGGSSVLSRQNVYYKKH